MLLEKVASQLNIQPETLERESLKIYLERQLRIVESELLPWRSATAFTASWNWMRKSSRAFFTRQKLSTTTSASIFWKVNAANLPKS